MKKLLVAGLLLASTKAFAGIIYLEDSFGTQGSSNHIDVGTLDKTLTISSFDTTLGTLTNVSITVFGQMDSQGFSTNQSLADGRADIGISIFQDWKVSTTVASDYIFRSANDPNPFLSASSAPLGSFNLVSGTLNDTFSYDLSSGEISASLTNIDLLAFTQDSEIDFNFTGFAQTVITNNVDSGTGLFSNSFQTGSWGKVAVSYTYDPMPVPEPGTSAIFALGLICIATRHFKKSP